MSRDKTLIKIEEMIDNSRPDLLPKFTLLKARGDYKELSLWLNELSSHEGLSIDIENALTDYFYSLR